MGCYCSIVNREEPQCVLNLKKFADNYDWSGLEFLVAINKIGIFEKKNDVSVNVLAIKGSEI